MKGAKRAVRTYLIYMLDASDDSDASGTPVTCLAEEVAFFLHDAFMLTWYMPIEVRIEVLIPITDNAKFKYHPHPMALALHAAFSAHPLKA